MGKSINVAVYNIPVPLALSQGKSIDVAVYNMDAAADNYALNQVAKPLPSQVIVLH